MRCLLAPLSRWLDQRIHARIEAAAARSAEISVEAFRRRAESLRQGQPDADPYLSMGASRDLAGIPFSRFVDGIDARINLRIAEALDAAGLLRPLPAGHVGLAEMAAAGISDAAAVHHAHDPARHGLSIERVALNAEASSGGMLDDLPPVGESFVQVIAAENGTILLGDGALLPDSHVQFGGITRMGPGSARAVAAALVRAADLCGEA